MQKQILIVNADARAGEGMAEALVKAGFGCEQAASMREALELVEHRQYDLAVLDVGPLGAEEMDSLSLLRTRGDFPLIALSPAERLDALVSLLSAGVEDYLLKPFEMRELIARVNVRLRCRAGAEPVGVLRHRDLEMHPQTYAVTLCDQPVRLTRQEFRILELMLSSPPQRVFSKQDFFDYAWKDCYTGVDKTVNVHICNIRKKFKKITDEEYIETIWGFGFRLI